MVVILYCQTCKNYWGLNKCAAFPNGIPQDIIRGEKLHDKPIKYQDGDFIYEKIDEKIDEK